MKRKYSLGIAIIMLGLSTSLYSRTLTRKEINRAKNLVRGARARSEQVWLDMYPALRGMGLRRQAAQLKETNDQIKNIELEIEKNVKENLDPTQRTLRSKRESELELNRVMMNAKVGKETNRVFSNLDNITSNVAKEIRDFRKAEAAATPKLRKLKKELIKYAKKIRALQAQIKILETSRTTKLERYYARMKKDSTSLFKRLQNIGKKMAEHASVEQSTVRTTILILENETKRTASPSLLKKLETTKNNQAKLLQQINTAVMKKKLILK
ncbi:hypothetical protein ACFLX2_00835 [Candidatus Dependentiae bacterium]